MALKLVCIVTISLFISSCSSTRDLVPTPNLILKNKNLLNSKNKDMIPRLIYITDRKPEIKKENFTYTSKRSSSMAFGLADVSFLGPKSWDTLQKESVKKNRDNQISLSLSKISEFSRFPKTPIPFKIVSGKILEDIKKRSQYDKEKEKLQRLIKKQLSVSDKKEVILYIHGFNNSFSDAILNLADIWHFSGRYGVPLLYSWPAGIGGLLGYFTERESGEFTIFHLKEFLRILKETKEILKVHVIAHSRGTDIVTSAMRELIIESKAAGRSPYKEYKIASLTLAAPDLDFEVVRQRLIAEKFAQGFGQINIYTNSADGALGVAQKLMSGIRFGKLQRGTLGENETKIFRSIKHVNFINVTGVKGFLGHSYYRSHPGALSDIIQIIKTNSLPGTPQRPLIHKGENFWELKANYLLE